MQVYIITKVNKQLSETKLDMKTSYEKTNLKKAAFF